MCGARRRWRCTFLGVSPGAAPAVFGPDRAVWWAQRGSDPGNADPSVAARETHHVPRRCSSHKFERLPLTPLGAGRRRCFSSGSTRTSETTSHSRRASRGAPRGSQGAAGARRHPARLGARRRPPRAEPRCTTSRAPSTTSRFRWSARSAAARLRTMHPRNDAGVREAETRRRGAPAAVCIRVGSGWVMQSEGARGARVRRARRGRAELRLSHVLSPGQGARRRPQRPAAAGPGAPSPPSSALFTPGGP